MAFDDASTPSSPRWWLSAHLTVAVCITVVIVFSFFAPPWFGWGIAAMLIGTAIAGTRWQMGALDAHTGRGYLLLTTLRITLWATLLCALATLHIAFSGLFVVLPFVLVPLTAPSLQRYALAMSCAVSFLMVGLTTIPPPVDTILIGAHLGACGFLLWLDYRADHTATDRRDVLPMLPHFPSTRLQDALDDPHGSEQRHRQHMHHLLCLVRAATRGHLAGIFWFDEEHQQLIPAFFEMDAGQRVHKRPFPLADVPNNQNHPQQTIWQLTDQRSAPWRHADHQDETQIVITKIEDEGILLGLLMVERLAQYGRFGRADEIAVQECAHLIHQHLRDEQAAAAAFRASSDLQAVALAAEKLSNTLDEDEVYHIGEHLFQHILADVQVAFFQQQSDTMQVSYVSKTWTMWRVNDALGRGPSLIEKAIERRHMLPYRPEGEREDPPLFGRQHAPIDLRYYLVCPLITGRRAHSAVVLKMPEPGAFSPVIRTRIGLIANQIAAAQGIALAYAQMTQRATHDSMTSLLNRATFQEEATRAFERAQRSRNTICAMMLDIDHFKNVNDTYGHAVGDDVICRVAAIIRQEVRRIDIAARYGGEEFVVVMENTDARGAEQFAERIRSRVEHQEVHTDRGNFHTTISVGIALSNADTHDIDALVQEADAALYESKNNGRNRVTMYQPTMVVDASSL